MRIYSPKFLVPFFFIPAVAHAVKVERSDANFNLEFIEGSRLDTSLKSEIFFTDNFLNSEQTKEDALGFNVNPSFFIQAHNEQHLVQLYTDLSRVSFSDFDEDNHTELTLLAKYFYRLSPDHRLYASASFDDKYEYRGTGLTKGLGQTVDKGDEKQDKLMNLGYQYGRLGSVSRFNLSLGVEESNYQTREYLTKYFDFDRQFIEADLDYLIATKTYFSALAAISDYDYNNAPDLSRKEQTLLAGVIWEYSAVSRFQLLLGIQRINFNSLDADENKFSWRASYTWKPTSYFDLSLLTTRQTEDEAELQSELKISDLYQLVAKYKIKDYAHLTMQLNYSESDIVFDSQINVEKSMLAKLALTYEYNDSLSMSMGISYNERDSEVPLYSFDSLLTSLGLEVVF